MDIYVLLLLMGVLILFSYFFEQLGKFLKMPSVILLLIVGVIIKQLTIAFEIKTYNFSLILPFFGTIALLLIVLEGALDLHLQKDKIKIIFKTFVSALLGVLVTALLIATFFHLVFESNFYNSLLNAVPFAVISSAVAIPSTFSLDKISREFIIYESTFSDILGILLFNFLTSHEHFTFNEGAIFGLLFLLTVLISAFLSVLLILYLNKIKHHVKFLPIFALLLIIFSVAKIYHFSSLVIVLVFGLLLNNSDLFIKGKFATYFNTNDLRDDLIHFRSITFEAVFLMKTFFFVLFGYSIQLQLLTNTQSILIALAIFALIFSTRFLRLWLLSRKNAKTLLFFAPRGLITLLLFLSIPAPYQLTFVNQGSITWLVLLSMLMLIVGLWTYKLPFEENDNHFVQVQVNPTGEKAEEIEVQNPEKDV